MAFFYNKIIDTEFIEGQGMFATELILHSQADPGVQSGVIEPFTQFDTVGVEYLFVSKPFYKVLT